MLNYVFICTKLIMITYIWSTLLLIWILLWCNYVHFFDHLLYTFLDIPTTMFRISSHWSFGIFIIFLKKVINYFYIDIWKLNITKLTLINEWFVVIYTYNSKKIKIIEHLNDDELVHSSYEVVLEVNEMGNFFFLTEIWGI